MSCTRTEVVNFKYNFKDRMPLCGLGLSMQLWEHTWKVVPAAGNSSDFFCLPAPRWKCHHLLRRQRRCQLSHGLAPAYILFPPFLFFIFFFSPASPLTVSSPFFFFSFSPFTYMHWDLTQSSWWFGFHIFFWNSFLLPLKKPQTTEALKALCKSLFLFMLGQNKIQNDSISQDHPIILQVHGSF